MLESCGVSAVTLHGRTAKMNKHLCGGANADAIAAVRAARTLEPFFDHNFRG